MWGNFASITKQLSENASQLASSSGLEEHLAKARSSVTGSLDALASNILTVEPAPLSHQGNRTPPEVAVESPPHTASDGNDYGWAADEAGNGEGDGWEHEDEDLPDDEVAGQHLRRGSHTFDDISLEDTPRAASGPSKPPLSPAPPSPSVGDQAAALAKARRESAALRRENAALKKLSATAQKAASAAEKQLAELTEKLASSDVSAKGMSSELEALRCRAEAAEAEADKLHLALEESERSMEQAKEEFRLLLKEAKEASQQSPLQVSLAQEDLEELQSQISKLQAQIALNKGEQQQSDSAAKAAQAEALQLREAMDRMKTSANSSVACLSSLLGHIEMLGDAVRAAKAAEEGAALRAAQAAHLEAELGRARLVADAASAFELLCSIDTALEDLVQKGGAEPQTATSGGSTACTATVEREKKELKAKVDFVSAKLEKAQGSRARAEAEAEDLRHKVAKLEALHSSSVADQQLADASNRELINSLTAKFKEAEGGRSRAELEAEGLRDKIVATTQSAAPKMVLQALRNFAPRDPPLLVQVAKLEAMLSSGLAERELADAENLEVIESLRAELEAATAKSEGRGVEVNRLSSQITGLTAALNSSLAEADSKAGSLAELRAAMQEIEVKEEEAREFCAKLERKLQESRAAVKQYQQEAAAVSEAARAAIEDAEAKVKAAERQLQEARAKSEEAIEGYCAELDSLKEKLEKSQSREKDLQERLGAVQEGSQASSRLATGRLADMQERLEEAKAQAAAASKAAKAAEETAAAAVEAASSAQLKMAEREESLRAAESKISRLVEELKLERETSESDKAAALTQFDAMMARQVEKARSEGREEGMAVVMERVAKLEEELSISNETLAGARQEAAEARKELEILGETDTHLQQALLAKQQLEEQLAEAKKQVVKAEAAAEAAAQESAMHRATAAERTKKFALLQAQFRRKEEALVARAEAAEAAVAGAASSATDTTAKLEAAALAKEAAEREREEAIRQLQEAEERLESVHARLEEQAKQCDTALAKVAALEASLEAAEASGKAAAEIASDQDYFERMVSAEAAARVSVAEKRVAEAQEEANKLREDINSYKEQAAMAEQAKIEMSLTLAQLDEGSQIRKPISGLPVGGRSELLQEITEQAEEAELAAAVSMRRAMTAENELAEARQRLAEMEKKAKDLSWQVKMLSDPSTIGGSAQGQGLGRTEQVGGMFDIFTCTGVRPPPR